ncbi:MAG: hypothetical protein ACK4UN_04940 [Limisphaerales bacterium]
MEKVAYGGWTNCIRLSNEEIELIATTDVGPRIIRFAHLGAPNLLKENKDQMGQTAGDKWRAYGGHRFWHAPEIMPRTYAPDNAPVEHKWDGKKLKLIQPMETTTGLQKELEITLEAKENRVTVLHRLRNRNLWDVEAAPWALTVMQGPGRAIFPHEPRVEQLLPVRPLVLWGYTDMKDPRWNWGSRYIQVKCDPKSKTAQKFGAMSTLGWGAYYRDGVVFVKRFGFDPKATYPDYGCNTECYTNGDMLEVESLGPLRKIPAGGKVEHVEHWYLFKASLSEKEDELSEVIEPLIRQTEAVK